MNKTVNARVNGAVRAIYGMMQVIENLGGGYRNRTGLHGFAIQWLFA